MTEQPQNVPGQFKYIESPNLPEAPVSLALVDGRIDAEAEDSLRKLRIRCIKTQGLPNLTEEVSFHPDMMFCHIGGRDIVFAPETCEENLVELKRYGFNLIAGNTRLKEKYPGDIAYNVAIIGKYAFHNLKHTDAVLRDHLIERGYELVNVSQGYAKCSVSILGKNAAITSDKGISAAMQKRGISVLTTEPDKNIHLGKLSNGFIGGCTGKIGADKIAFAGNAEKLASFELISDYIKKYGIKHISLGSGDVRDIGSVIPLATF